MIEKVYKCNLCLGHHDAKDCEAYRILWKGDEERMTLYPLITSANASEDIICVKCILGAGKALARQFPGKVKP